MNRRVRWVVLEVVGWLLLGGGIAALVLPGPGLLLLFAGLAVLSQQHEWAARWVEPVRLRALRGAAQSVETWPRIVVSSVAAFGLGALGVLWIVHPAVPDWWPIGNGAWWLPGGMWAGVTLDLSAVIALTMIVYSYRRFHGKPEALADLEQDIEEADEELDEDRVRD